MIWLLALALGAAAAASRPSPSKTTRDRDVAPIQWVRDGLTAEVLAWGDGWRWRVRYNYADAGRTLAEGWRSTIDEAKADADQWIAQQAAQSTYDQQTRHGLRVSADCETIAVARVDEWIAWAAPRMPQPDDEIEPDGFLRSLFGEVFPECTFDAPLVRGTPWDRVVEQFAMALERAAAGTIVDVADQEEVLAARAVGLSAPKRDGKAVALDLDDGSSWVVVVDPHPSGTGWRWRVWPDRRQGDPTVERVASSRDGGISAATAWIEAQGRKPREVQ